MVTQSAMYLNRSTNNQNIRHLSKAAIFVIAALFSYMRTFAQMEYNNWMIGTGTVISFAPSFNIQTNDNDDIYSWPFAISGNNGKIILYGYLENSEDSEKRFVIKNANNKTVVSEEKKYTYVRNLVYCKTNNGQYYVAVVLREPGNKIENNHIYLTENLHIYRFDAHGNLKKRDVFDSADYKPFLAMVPRGEYVELMAYNNYNKSIETFKLTATKVIRDKQINTSLGKFASLGYFSFKIRQSIDGSVVFAISSNDLFVVSFNQETGDVKVAKKENCGFHEMTLSPNDKYLVVLKDKQLIGYAINSYRDIDISEGVVLYDFSSQNVEQLFDFCWDTQTGIDGNVYLLVSNFEKYHIFIVKDIETSKPSLQIVEVEESIIEKYIPTVTYNTFPQIMRRPKSQIAPCDVMRNPRIIPE